MIDIVEINRALTRMLKLPRGWDYGRDGPAMASAVGAAKRLVSALSRMDVTGVEVLPGSRGTTTVVAVRHADELEITCRTTGLYDLSFASGGDEIDVEKMTYGEVLCLLREKGWVSLRSFGSCTHAGTVIYSDDTPVRLSSAPVMELVSQSLAPIASMQAAPASATMCVNTTIHRSLESRPSSGAYKRVIFLTEAS